MAERQVSNYAGAVPACQRFEDLLERPALRAIGLIMRPLLDRLGMTPLELVTLKAVTAPVKRAAGGIDAAITLAARLQAEALGVKLRDRIPELESLAEDCRMRVRAANRATDPLVLGPIGLDRFAAAIAEHHRAESRRFWALRGIAEFIAEPADYPAKLDRLLELNIPELGAPATALFDEAAACLVDHSDVVRALLGPAPDLHMALFRLADLALGTPPPNAAAAAAQLAHLLEQERLPKTQEALWDRLGRSLAGQRPLTGGTLMAEHAAIERVLRHLLPQLPAAFQADAHAGLIRRQTRVLQAILDETDR